MENSKKICGLLGGQLKKNIVAELHGIFGQIELKHFTVANDELSAFLKRESFDALNVDISLRRIVMPLMSKTSPEARLGGGVDLILRLPNGKLYGHNTELYGFAYLLDRAGIDVSGKKCMILGNGSDAVAVFAVLKERAIGGAVLMTRDRFESLPEHRDTDIIIATARGENISLDGFDSLEAVIDIRLDQLNSKLLQDASARGIPAIGGYAMAAAGVKLSRELMTGVEIPESELSAAIRRLTANRTSMILVGSDAQAKNELGKAAAESFGRRHYDLDLIIEQLNGKSVDKIISQNGESELRRIEHVAAEWAGKQTGAIISTGNKIAAREDNCAALKKNGIVVFLAGEHGGDFDDRYRAWCDLELDSRHGISENIDKLRKIIEE